MKHETPQPNFYLRSESLHLWHHIFNLTVEINHRHHPILRIELVLTQQLMDSGEVFFFNMKVYNPTPLQSPTDSTLHHYTHKHNTHTQNPMSNNIISAHCRILNNSSPTRGATNPVVRIALLSNESADAGRVILDHICGCTQTYVADGLHI